MSPEETIAHWLRTAKESCVWARKMYEQESHALALFHCHLSAEKGLKARYMQEKNVPAPHTHNLQSLALLLPLDWTEKDMAFLKELTPFCRDSRYGDEHWVEEMATPERAQRMVEGVEHLLTRLFP